jgi:hypothetical protein
MSIVQGACTSFKEELLQAIHDFTSDTFKIALYSSSASLGPNTTVYTAVAEISGTGYTSTGKALTISQVPVSAGGIAYVSFSDVSWESSTITARGALIYNSSKSNKAVAVLDFGSNKTTSGSTFTVTFPAPNQTSAIVRIS